MGQAAQKTIFIAADYLAWESAQLDRHEFLDGEGAKAGVNEGWGQVLYCNILRGREKPGVRGKPGVRSPILHRRPIKRYILNSLSSPYLLG